MRQKYEFSLLHRCNLSSIEKFCSRDFYRRADFDWPRVSYLCAAGTFCNTVCSNILYRRSWLRNYRRKNLVGDEEIKQNQFRRFTRPQRKRSNPYRRAIRYIIDSAVFCPACQQVNLSLKIYLTIRRHPNPAGM